MISARWLAASEEKNICNAHFKGIRTCLVVPSFHGPNQSIFHSQVSSNLCFSWGAVTLGLCIITFLHI